jgi:DNA modification methylase
MTTNLIQISKLVEVPELKNFYTQQSNEDLKASIEEHGLRSPIVISKDNNSLIDGYRRVAVYNELGIEYIQAFEVEDSPTLSERITRNLTRVKTIEDQLKEIREVFKKYPKQQGKRKKGGEPYARDKKITAATGGKWKGDVIINKVEQIFFDDFGNNLLAKGILEKGWKVDPCHEFLTKWKPIDDERGYGYTKRLESGEISINDVNNLVKERYELDTQYEDTFVIPDKAISHKIDCVDLGKNEAYNNTVDTIFTSIPYYILRSYDEGGKDQPGHEETKYEFCERMSNFFKGLVPMLKESANVMINIGETYDNGVGYGIPDLLKEYIEKNTGLIYKDRLVWSKFSNPKPQNEKVPRPINNVEYILWFVVNPAKAKFRLLTFTDKNKNPVIIKGVKDVDKNGSTRKKNISLSKPYSKFYTHLKEQEVLNIINAKTGKNHDVYKICNEGHPAIMSAVLPVVPILMTTDEGDTVLDPFAGSNVVGRVTCLLNRKALSGELSKKYYDIGCKMLENAVSEFDRNSLDIIQDTFYNKEVVYEFSHN